MDNNLPSAPVLFQQTRFLYRSLFSRIAFVCCVLFLSNLLQDIAVATNHTSLATLAFVLNLIISFLSYLAFILAISDDPLVKEKPTTLYDRAITLIGPYSWLALIILLATIGGATLFVVPALILSVFLSVATYVLILENRRGFDALIASWYYVEDRWWPVTWRIFFFSAIVFIISLVVNFAIFLFSSPQGLTNISQYQPSIFGSAIGDAFSAFVIVPISVIYFYRLYVSLKAVKTGEPTAANRESIRKWILGFVIFGIAVLLIGSVFAAHSILKYLPQFIRTAPMPASVVYSPFLR